MSSRALRRIADGLFAVRRYLLDQPLFTSTILPAIPRPVRWALRTAYLLPVDLIDRAVGRRRAMVPPRSKMFVGSVDDFESSGELLVGRLIEVGGLTPGSSVLDIGSGIGRLAARTVLGRLSQRVVDRAHTRGLHTVPDRAGDAPQPRDQRLHRWRMKDTYVGTAATLPDVLQRAVLQQECRSGGCPSSSLSAERERIQVDWITIENAT